MATSQFGPAGILPRWSSVVPASDTDTDTDTDTNTDTDTVPVPVPVTGVKRVCQSAGKDGWLETRADAAISATPNDAERSDQAGRASALIKGISVNVAERLALVPEPWRGRVARAHMRRADKFRRRPGGFVLADKLYAALAADSWLYDTTAIFERVRLPVGVSDADIRQRAEDCAKQAMSLAEVVPGVFVASVADLRARLARFVETYGVTPPSSKVEDMPSVRRMTSPAWWRRALRVAQARRLEQGAVALGYVHRDAEKYASDATVARRQEQRRRNAAALENTEAYNLDMGDVFTLAQLAAVSAANPAIRRGELMTRIAGFEACARTLDHIAEFITLTAPSRFHRMRKTAQNKIVRNEKFDGSTPRDAQSWLVRTWARLRAKLARMGLRVYGFRIAEPHHDATPHWHLLLFMPRALRAGTASVPRFRAVFRRYALNDAGDEAGAKQYRTKFEAIDWNRGTAAGYVLKYVAKNIDGNGYDVQGDSEGGGELYPAQRVEAWASTWGIRQFQQVGGPPVGVWRELRRMREATDGPAVLEDARAAADVGNWRRFVEVMGGPVVARADLPLRVAYTEPGERIHARTGEVQAGRLNCYGESAAPVAWGVRYLKAIERRDGIAVWPDMVEWVAASARFQWEIRRGKRETLSDIGFSFVAESGAQGNRVFLKGDGAADATRSPVNNCTRLGGFSSFAP